MRDLRNVYIHILNKSNRRIVLALELTVSDVKNVPHTYSFINIGPILVISHQKFFQSVSCSHRG